MLRKLGIVTAALAVIMGAAAPAALAGFDSGTRTATVVDEGIGIGAHFLNVADAEAQDAHDGWTVVNASCTIHAYALLAVYTVDPFCHIFDATATKWYPLADVVVGVDYGSASGQFVVPARHVLKLCVDGLIWGSGHAIGAWSPCQSLL